MLGPTPVENESDSPMLRFWEQWNIFDYFVLTALVGSTIFAGMVTASWFSPTPSSGTLLFWCCTISFSPIWIGFNFCTLQFGINERNWPFSRSILGLSMWNLAIMSAAPVLIGVINWSTLQWGLDPETALLLLNVSIGMTALSIHFCVEGDDFPFQHHLWHKFFMICFLGQHAFALILWNRLVYDPQHTKVPGWVTAILGKREWMTESFTHGR